MSIGMLFRSVRMGLLALVLTGLVSLFCGTFVHAETAEELQAQIKDRADKMAALEQEIQRYQTELNKTAEQRQTLERDVKVLDTSRKKISTSINLTEEKIKATESTISEIGLSIEDKERRMKLNKDAVAASIRAQYVADNDSYLETLLGRVSLKDFWESLDQIASVQSAFRDDVGQLLHVKAELQTSQMQAEETHKQLAGLKENLGDQKQALDVTRSAKTQILTTTKSQESSYQQILKEKQAAKLDFEKEMNQLEAKLKFTLDLNSIPKAGSGILSWPFDPVYMVGCADFNSVLGNLTCITQYFGNTQFSKIGAYNGQGHNGIDFRAPIGTPIAAALTGTVQAINQGVAPNCQYGKWVLIKHDNGLTTLYAHLSQINVAQGQTVATGATIGFAGNTGYATGPHLHFTVYASAAVTFKEYRCKSGLVVTVPVAAFNAYLNPLVYL